MSTAEKRPITIALAGNANVGKSVIFNYFTGLHQHIGNWPGKTVEKAEGTLHFKGHAVDVIDLPGIYSLSAFSIEERVSREYIAIQKPDIVINIVDASVLERNLFFTIQLLELETPMIMALNQMDVAKGKGITINIPQLQKSLGIPIIPTIATGGTGLDKLLGKAVKIAKGKKANPAKMRYGREIEEKISKVTKLVEKIPIKYPPRWVAIKLLEGDEEIRKIVGRIDQKIVSSAERYARDLERIHGELCSTIITSERYNVANKIARGSQRITPPRGPSLTERLDAVTTHPVMGYPILIGIMFLVLFTVFTVGGYLSGFFEDVMGPIRGAFGGEIGELIGEGVFGGLIAGIAIVLPFILPFYLILTLLEGSGYLPRAAFMTDNLMHRMGIHGKAFIPFILGYGCNVPACLGCRIMETERERTIAAFVVTLVPCAAVTVVVLGLVGAFVGIHWALALYLLNLVIIFILGRVAFKVLPGESMGLIMEMPPYRKPHVRSVLKETWMRVKDFVYIAFPLIIIGSVVLTGLKVGGLLEPIGNTLSPVTVGWLGLPAITGVLLVFGVLRKELTLVMLATLMATTNFATVLTPIQMIVFAIVVMYYIPCIATIAALVRELGWKKAAYITVFEIAFALLIGGIAFRLLTA
ncbi:MAG: ferrous iron transport protein B [Hadesarchaea archaeon]|nr:MAG: ferrous iron transport protein B [Hadesarchaea archaeon]